MKELSGLPERKLSVIDVAAIESADAIADAQPQFVVVEDSDTESQDDSKQEVIGMTVIFQTGAVSIICFNPVENVWVELVNEETSNTDALDDGLDAVFEKMNSWYNVDGYGTVGRL